MIKTILIIETAILFFLLSVGVVSADNRVDAVRGFFQDYNSILSVHAETFVQSADDSGVDWRILPAVAMAESTGCKRYIKETNNCFGWGGGKVAYPSLRYAIQVVTEKIGVLPVYRKYRQERTIESFARIYNPGNWRDYAGKIKFFVGKLDAGIEKLDREVADKNPKETTPLPYFSFDFVPVSVESAIPHSGGGDRGEVADNSYLFAEI